MAVCEYCHHEMQTHHSCLWEAVRIKRQPYLRLRYGEETRYGSKQPGYWRDYGENCPDCAVVVGGLHHVGCDWEQCPRCQSQFIVCDCPPKHFTAELAVTDKVQHQ